MIDNRTCRICGDILYAVQHQIFGGSPTFHGFEESGERVAPIVAATLQYERTPKALRDRMQAEAE